MHSFKTLNPKPRAWALSPHPFGEDQAGASPLQSPPKMSLGVWGFWVKGLGSRGLVFKGLEGRR